MQPQTKTAEKFSETFRLAVKTAELFARPFSEKARTFSQRARMSEQFCEMAELIARTPRKIARLLGLKGGALPYSQPEALAGAAAAGLEALRAKRRLRPSRCCSNAPFLPANFAA